MIKQFTHKAYEVRSYAQLTDSFRKKLVKDLEKMQKYVYILEEKPGKDKKKAFTQKWKALSILAAYFEAIGENDVIETLLNDATYVPKDALTNVHAVLKHQHCVFILLNLNKEWAQEVQLAYPISPLFLKHSIRTYFKYRFFQVWLPIQYFFAKQIAHKVWWFKKRNCITKKHVRKLVPKLQNGDILLQRSKFKVSNSSIPGFWTHVMLYADGFIYEAVPFKVRKVKITKAIQADYVCVLRPNVRLRDKEKAIAFAQTCVGRPYDFNFDFLTNDSLVCSEVVLKAYPKIVTHIPKYLGRHVFQPNEFVALVPEKLSLVCFIDSVGGKIHFGTQDAFLKTLFRSRFDLLRE